MTASQLGSQSPIATARVLSRPMKIAFLGSIVQVPAEAHQAVTRPRAATPAPQNQSKSRRLPGDLEPSNDLIEADPAKNTLNFDYRHHNFRT